MTTKFSGKTRIESALLGEMEVPVEALYGVQTLRGIVNFPISRFHLNDYPLFINGLAITKLAAAEAAVAAYTPGGNGGNGGNGGGRFIWEMILEGIFDDKILKIIGRRHTSFQTQKAVGFGSLLFPFKDGFRCRLFK